jgi:hypothetical protein
LDLWRMKIKRASTFSIHEIFQADEFLNKSELNI